MVGFEIIGDHPFLIGFVLVGGFMLWKFVIQPIINEGQPLDPDEDQVEGFKPDLGLPES